MGIKNFYKFIKLNCPEAIEYINKNELYNKKIGIDGNFWLYQIMGSMKSNNIKITNNNNLDITHVYGLYLRILSILKLGIKPLFVFDGKAPKIKNDTINKRIIEKSEAKKRIENDNFISEKEKKRLIQNSFFINKKEIEDCKLLLEKMNIPYIQSLEESDSQLAYLCKKNYIDYVISNDADILIFGAKNIMPFFKSSNNKFSVINKNKIIEKLDFKEDDIIKLGIVLGNDYNSLNRNKINLRNIKYELNDVDNVKFKELIDYYKNPLIKKYNCKYLEFDINKNINIKKLLV